MRRALPYASAVFAHPDHEAPLGRLLQDALALPIFDGGNIGVRRRQLHTMLKRPDYEPCLRAVRLEASQVWSDAGVCS
jgi:hypothetical protein